MNKETILKHFGEWKAAQEGMNGVKLGWPERLSWLSGYMAGFSVGKKDLDPIEFQKTFQEVITIAAQREEGIEAENVRVDQAIKSPYINNNGKEES